MRDGGKGEELRELTALVGGLAHEIKNPLSTININLELLREDWAAESSPIAGRSVRKIDVLLQETRRLERMLADFLRLAAATEPDLRETDINALLEDVLDFLRPELQRRGVEVASQLDRSLPRLRLDGGMMRQAVLNLLKNALEALESARGTLWVSTARTDDDEARIDVVDSGPGMSAETRERIFNAYFSTKAAGTGLGLPMVRKIVERHGGRVTCESAQGSGTRFSVYLPLGSVAEGGT